MKKKKKIIMISLILFILIITVITLYMSFSYAWFQKDVSSNKSQIFKTGNFSISFSKGDNVVIDNTYPMSDKTGNTLEPNKIKITNNGNYYSCYYISLRDDDSTLKKEQLKYSINKQTNLFSSDILLLGGIPAGGNATLDFRTWVNELETNESAMNKTYNGSLTVVAESCSNSLGNKIFKNNPIEKNKKGLNKVNTKYGSTYIFKGNVDNNYVKINNDLYKIIRVNEDGTIRLIKDTSLESVSYGDNFKNTSLLQSNVYQTISKWYNSLDGNAYIANSSFDDRFKVSENSELSYNNYAKTVDNYNNSLDYKNNVSSKFGLISYEEIKNSYIDNESYLQNIKTWTLSRSGLTNDLVKMWIMDDGIKSIEAKNEFAVHPVISVNSNIKVSGNGTKENPYTLIK